MNTEYVLKKIGDLFDEYGLSKLDPDNCVFILDRIRSVLSSDTCKDHDICKVEDCDTCKDHDICTVEDCNACSGVGWTNPGDDWKACDKCGGVGKIYGIEYNAH